MDVQQMERRFAENSAAVANHEDVVVAIKGCWCISLDLPGGCAAAAAVG